MIRLDSKPLTKGIQDTLDDLQSHIDAEPTFVLKVEKAQSLWNTKGGKTGRDAFETIREKLLDLCVFTGICNYCEQNEANDIEHIHPKSFFPMYTFDWENYILACKQCNSGQKLDKGYVLNAADDLVPLVRTIEPSFSRIAFINIRNEDPESFMLLNPVSHKFELIGGLTKADQKKAKATLEILELNERDTLLAARKSAAKHYYEVLERLSKILTSQSISELAELLVPNEDKFDFTRNLADLKEELRDSFREYISKYQHPSVWYTIKKVQSTAHPKWAKLFNIVPDALIW